MTTEQIAIDALTMQEFIERYDKPDAVILLEGKRAVLPEDNNKLIKLGELLARNTEHCIFRSGNADGSDSLFAQGLALANATDRFQVVTPYSGHRKKTNVATTTFALDELPLVAEHDIVYATKEAYGKGTLPEQYFQNNKAGMKAAYLLRDTVKVLGFPEENILPATFAFFYVDLAEPTSGGTGHTIRVCEARKVPHCNQRVWFSWLEA